MSDNRFLATINTPGYLPTDDSPPVFDTAREAWDYLLGERRDAEDYAIEDGEGEGYSATFNILEQLASGNDVSDLTGVDSSDLTGSVVGDTPGAEWSRANDDLGLVYTVTELTHVNYPHEPGRLYDCPACESSCHCKPGETECIYSGDHTP